MKSRLAYLLPHPPKLSETFVTDELEEMARRGTAVEVYALLDSAPTAAARARALAASVPGVIAAQFYWIARSPRQLLRTWATALTQHARSPKLFARAVLGVGVGARFAIQMQSREVEHVHAHFATHSALAAWVISRLTGIPYSFTAHADDIFVRRPMLAQKVAEASFVVAISEFNRRWLAQQVGESAARRIHVVRCGVPADGFVPLPPVDPDALFTILCVGRLEAKKGQRDLIEACRRLRDRGIAFRCWLVGEGRERARIERAREAAGLGDQVALFGAQPRSAVRALLAETHVVVLPSVVTPDGRSDGIPIALMEAMAVARPVVSTRVSGIPELIVDGHSGRLVEPGDPGALADALEQIHRDPAGAARIAREAARRVRERFDLGDNVGALQRLFDDAHRNLLPFAPIASGIALQVEPGEARR